MCSVGNFRKNFNDRATADILAELQQGRALGFDRVEFTGGEPTARLDFLTLISEAKKIGYKTVSVGTNGRLFSYKNFCREAFHRGLFGVNFSLHGSSAKLQDAITRTPGAFNQTIDGIKNALEESGSQEVYVLSAIFRLNINDIEGLAKLIKSLGVQNWNPLNLVPEGTDVNLYKNLSVPLKELSAVFRRNLHSFLLVPNIYFFDFPMCVFSPAFLESPKHFHFITARERTENIKQVGYNPRSVKKIDHKYIDERRMCLPICERCRYQNECGGIWQKYIKIFGVKRVAAEVAKLARENGCLV